jgi:hypothetical protein
VRTTEQGHGHQEFLAQELQPMLNARRAADGEATDMGPVGVHRRDAQRADLDHIRAAADATIHHHRHWLFTAATTSDRTSTPTRRNSSPAGCASFRPDRELELVITLAMPVPADRTAGVEDAVRHSFESERQSSDWNSNN